MSPRQYNNQAPRKDRRSVQPSHLPLLPHFCGPSMSWTVHAWTWTCHVDDTNSRRDWKSIAIVWIQSLYEFDCICMGKHEAFMPAIWHNCFLGFVPAMSWQNWVYAASFIGVRGPCTSQSGSKVDLRSEVSRYLQTSPSLAKQSSSHRHVWRWRCLTILCQSVP